MGDLIKASLSPAEGLSVTFDDKLKIATVMAPEDQLSMAIGRDGQNVRLAAKLTGWKIEVVGIPASGPEGSGPEGEKEKQVKQVEHVVQDESKKSKIKKEKEPKAEIEKIEKKVAIKKDRKTKETKVSKKTVKSKKKPE